MRSIGRSSGAGTRRSTRRRSSRRSSRGWPSESSGARGRRRRPKRSYRGRKLEGSGDDGCAASGQLSSSSGVQRWRPPPPMRVSRAAEVSVAPYSDATKQS